MLLDGIEVFTEVVDAKSFSRAARRLGMPVSTVSGKVARLEERLGVTLIQRTTRQLNVTDAGQNYYAYCVRALAEMSEAEEQLAQTRSAPTGTLRLTAPADLAQSVLTPLILDFLDIYPEMKIDLVVTNRSLDLIAENVDLALRVGSLRDSSLISRKLLTVSMTLWAAPSYLVAHGTPETVADLAQHERIALSMADKELELFDDDGTVHRIANTGRVATDDMQSTRTLIEAGAGIGTLPDFVGEDGARTGRLVRVLPQISSHVASAYFVYPAQRFVPNKVRAFIDNSKTALGRSG